MAFTNVTTPKVVSCDEDVQYYPVSAASLKRGEPVTIAAGKVTIVDPDGPLFGFMAADAVQNDVAPVIRPNDNTLVECNLIGYSAGLADHTLADTDLGNRVQFTGSVNGTVAAVYNGGLGAYYHGVIEKLVDAAGTVNGRVIVRVLSKSFD